MVHSECASVSTRTPGPPGTLKTWMRPGDGTNVSGSSALMRHSIECPVNVTSPCLNAEPLAGRDPDLLLDDVDAGHHLGDRMLDLQARVRFHEVEAAVRIHQELERAGVRVLHRLGGVDRRSLPILRRIFSVSAGDGDSSISFWWRRWIEHSRSPRWTTLP